MPEPPAEQREREEPQTPSRKPWWRIGKGGVKRTVVISVGAIGLAASLITISQVWPRSGPGITFTNPPPNAVTPVPCVFTATGRGSPPSGQALVLSSQQQGIGSNVDSTMYFAVASLNSPDPGMWHVVLQVGKASTVGGTLFTLTSWLVNANWVNYWTQANPHPTWWGTPGTPPGAKKIQFMTVSRTAGKCS